MGPWVHGHHQILEKTYQILEETYPILKETYQILNGALIRPNKGPNRGPIRVLLRALFWALFSLCGLPDFPFVGLMGGLVKRLVVS